MIVDSSSSDFLETDSTKQLRKAAKKQAEIDRLTKLRATIPRFEIAQSGTRIFGNLQPVEQLTHNQVYQINSDSEEEHSPTGLSWDQEELDEAYRKYALTTPTLQGDTKIKITDAEEKETTKEDIQLELKKQTT